MTTKKYLAWILAHLTLQNILNVVQLVGIPLALVALYQTNNALKLQEESNRLSLISAAWANLNAPATGNSGKAKAIETLINSGERMVGLKIDCDSMGGTYAIEPYPTCIGAPYFEDLKISPPKIGDADLMVASYEEMKNDPALLCELSAELKFGSFQWASFDGGYVNCGMIVDFNFGNIDAKSFGVVNSWLYNVIFSNASLYDFKFDYSRFEGVDFSNAELVNATFTNVQFSGVNLKKAKLDRSKFNVASVSDINVSGTDFCYDTNLNVKDVDNCAEFINDEIVAAMWAWADMPPEALGPLATSLRKVALCDPKLRDNYSTLSDKYYGFTFNREYTKPLGC
jgi:Pentapeptide repeats (8 copies)